MKNKSRVKTFLIFCRKRITPRLLLLTAVGLCLCLLKPCDWGGRLVAIWVMDGSVTIYFIRYIFDPRVPKVTKYVEERWSPAGKRIAIVCGSFFAAILSSYIIYNLVLCAIDLTNLDTSERSPFWKQGVITYNQSTWGVTTLSQFIRYKDDETKLEERTVYLLFSVPFLHEGDHYRLFICPRSRYVLMYQKLRAKKQ